MSKKNIVIANWKCNPSKEKDALLLAKSIARGVSVSKNVEIVISPPFIYLPILKKTNLKLAAQDCFWQGFGPFTGEISPLMLKNLNVEYVILGHSERRKYFNETDEIIAKKTEAALINKLSPILCVGETMAEKEKKKTKEILTNQLRKILLLINKSKFNVDNFVIAYEPRWAIGSGNSCDPSLAKDILVFLKDKLARNLKGKIIRNIRIIYGGSTDSQNAEKYLTVGFKGFLVGGSSLKAQEFIKIMKSCDS